MSYSECTTPYSRVSYSKCPTPCQFALLRIDTKQSPASYKDATPVGAVSNRRFKAVQGSNRSEDREIELISKKVRRKRLGKVLSRRN